MLFDLDNTLHNRDAGLVGFVRAQYGARNLAGRGVDVDDWTYRFVTLDAGGRVWKDVVYERLAEEFDLGIAPAELLEEYETEFARYVVPVLDLMPTLNELRRRGWRMGIVSNGRSRFQRRTLAALDIDAWIDRVVISEECGFRKPDPEIFRLALREIECALERSWFVGDDPVADVEGAKRAGMQAIWFRAVEGSRLGTVLDAIESD